MGLLWARSKEAREEANPPIAPLEFCIFPKKKRKREKRKIDKKDLDKGQKKLGKTGIQERQDITKIIYKVLFKIEIVCQLFPINILG